MSHEKQEVIDFLREKDSLSPYDQFNKAFNYYRNHPRKSRSLELSYNRLGYSEQALKNILYDLRKMFDVSEVEIHSIPVVPAIEEKVEEKDPLKLFIVAFGELTDVAKKMALQLFKVTEVYGEEMLEVPSIKEYFAAVNKELVCLIESNEAFLDITDSALDSLVDHFKHELEAIEVSEEVKVLITEAAKGKVVDDSLDSKKDFIEDLKQEPSEDLKQDLDLPKVREEFPFLNDDDCPEVLLVVVGKRITAFNKYQRLHAQLQEANEGKVEISAEEKAQLAKDTEAAFAENRLCWEELEHYGKNKAFLGKHPIFYESNVKNEVDLMTNEELIKFKNSSVKYFSDQRAQLVKHAGKEDKLEVIRKRIADREFKLSLVNAKLGVSQDDKK